MLVDVLFGDVLASSRRESVDVVHVTLRTVEEETLDAAADTLFKCLAENAGPVGGDFCAADGVGVRTEVHDCDIGSARAPEAYHIHLFVRCAERLFYFRVVGAGVCAYGTVLHPVAADE